jgi:hypothetical protein
MSRPFILEITESETELKQRLQQAREAAHKEKLQMLWWLKSGQVSQQQEIGQRLGRDTSTVTRWLHLDLGCHCPLQRRSFFTRVSQTQWGVFSGVFGLAVPTVG